MKIKFILIASMVVAALFLGGLSSTSPAIQSLIETSKSRADVVEQAQKAVVHITVEKTVSRRQQMFSPFDQFPGFQRQRQPRSFKQQGQGSGSIINDEGYILTNNHVVGDSDKITVVLNDGREFEATVIGTDPDSDIAVIKIDGEDLPSLPMGDSDKIRIAETVIAIGNPFGLSNTVTMGIISAKGRSNIGIVDYENFIQTDAAINPGNSGGPLIDLEGKIVGVNTAIFSRNGGGNQGIGFAVPINMASRIMTQLIEKGKVSRGWLGVSIQNVTPELQNALGLENTKGSLISAVMVGSPAEKAGMKRGDVVVSLNEDPITSSSDLSNKVGMAPAGSEAVLEIVRKGAPMTISVRLGEREVEIQNTPFARPEEKPFGIAAQPLTPDLAKKFDLESVSGVLISQVEPDSLAAQAGLRPGHVIQEVDQQPIDNMETFRTAMKDGDPKKGILLLVVTRNGSRYLILRDQ